MSKLGKKRLVSRLARSPLTYLILIIFVGLFVYSSVGAYNKSRLARKKVTVASSELASLQEQKIKLGSDLESANTDFGTEKAIREKFNVVKKGEKVIMIVHEEPVEPEDRAGKDGFWQFLKNIFTKD